MSGRASLEDFLIIIVAAGTDRLLHCKKQTKKTQPWYVQTMKETDFRMC